MNRREPRIERAIALMRAAQAELDAAKAATVAAHLETAIGFAEAELDAAKAHATPA